MVTHNEIRIALKTNDFAGLRALHTRAKTEGIEGCDARQLSTVNLGVIECAVLKGTSPAHERQLEAMLQAIERGKHPYDDPEASAMFDADAAIAQAQLNAMIDKGASK